MRRSHEERAPGRTERLQFQSHSPPPRQRRCEKSPPRPGKEEGGFFVSEGEPRPERRFFDVFGPCVTGRDQGALGRRLFKRCGGWGVERGATTCAAPRRSPPASGDLTDPRRCPSGKAQQRAVSPLLTLMLPAHTSAVRTSSPRAPITASAVLAASRCGPRPGRLVSRYAHDRQSLVVRCTHTRGCRPCHKTRAPPRLPLAGGVLCRWKGGHRPWARPGLLTGSMSLAKTSGRSDASIS